MPLTPKRVSLRVSRNSPQADTRNAPHRHPDSHAKPGERPYKLSDGGWLFLVVNPTGSKLWRMAYRLDGKERTLSFGTYPTVGLRAARDRRDEAKELLAAGQDPGQKKKADKIARAISAATSFESVAEEYLDKLRREARAPATIDKVMWLLALAAPKLALQLH